MPNKRLIALGLGTLIIVIILTLSALAEGSEVSLYEFRGLSKGGLPIGTLVFDAEGNLYGTTSLGGSNRCPVVGCGTVFQLKKGKDGEWTERVLYAFQGGLDGQNPFAGVVFDDAGNLYGTTLNGGRFSFGTVFMLSPTQKGRWTETILHEFTGNPSAAMSSTELYSPPVHAVHLPQELNRCWIPRWLVAPHISRTLRYGGERCVLASLIDDLRGPSSILHHEDYAPRSRSNHEHH